MTGGGVRTHAPAKHVVVGISEGKVSGDPETILVTYALGSCIAICAFDPAAGVAGLLHIMLPDSALDRRKAEANPCVFADTGVPVLIRQMVANGASERRLTVRLAGGAQLMADGSLFSIGKRNHAAVRKILWKAGLLVDGEEVGGEVCRTVRMDVATGRVRVREGGGSELEIPLKGTRYGT